MYKNSVKSNLKRNEYLNIGPDDTKTWECRKALADAIVAYVDYCETGKSNRENIEKAFFILEVGSGSYGHNPYDILKLFRNACVREDCNPKTAHFLNKILKFDRNEIIEAAKIMYQFNIGIFTTDITSTDQRNKIEREW